MKYRDLLDKIQNALQGEKKEPESQHSYARDIALLVPKNLPRQAPAKPVVRKTDIVTKEWNKEVRQTSNCSSHIESETPPGANLIPERVHRWTIKNYSSIVRKMQMLIKSTETEMSENISVISSEETAKNQDELLLDMMKRREERHFRIERPTL